MEFHRRLPEPSTVVGILAAAFHPPTRAHQALAGAALSVVEEVLFVLPRSFPHKDYDRVGLPERLAMVMAMAESGARFSVAVSDGGLFIDIVREARPHYPPEARFWLICGSDAAERIVGWDYGREGEIERQLEEYGLLVAPRPASYRPPPRLASRIRALELAPDFREISSTMVRERIVRGETWEHLVPAEVRELARRHYS